MNTAKQHRPLASVIIPCKNEESTIASCIKKLLECKADIEIIAADDSSTDATFNILTDIASANPAVHAVKSIRPGVSAARNTAIGLASGKYIMFADADDTVLPDAFNEALRLMEYSGADFLIAPHIAVEPFDGPHTLHLHHDFNISSNEEIRKKLVHLFLGYSNADIESWYKGAPLFETNREFGYSWRCCFKRELISNFSIKFPEDVSYAEDALFISEYLLHAQKTVQAGKPFYRYNVPEPSKEKNSETSSPKASARNKLNSLYTKLRIAGDDAQLLECFRASCVLSMLDILRTPSGGHPQKEETAATVREYSSCRFYKESLKRFPVSFRKPLLALAIMSLRIFGTNLIFKITRLFR